MNRTPDLSDPAERSVAGHFVRAFARRYLRPAFLVQTLGALVAAYFLSSTLARLSGSALWLPEGWRVSMETIATGIGFGAFSIAHMLGDSPRRRRARSPHGAFEAITASVASTADGANVLTVAVETPVPAARDASRHASKAEEELHARRRRHLLSIYSTIAAFVFLVCYMGLRSRCVIPCDVKGWVASQERIAVAMNVRPEGAASASRDAENVREEQAGHRYSKIIEVPDFMDPVRDEIYVPVYIPHPEADYIESQGKKFDQDGLTYVLDHETDLVVDWLRRPWQPLLFFTTVIFAILHLMIMACVGTAAGFVDPLEKLAEVAGARR